MQFSKTALDSVMIRNSENLQFPQAAVTITVTVTVTIKTVSRLMLLAAAAAVMATSCTSMHTFEQFADECWRVSARQWRSSVWLLVLDDT
jgi:hypothetical protein